MTQVVIRASLDTTCMINVVTSVHLSAKRVYRPVVVMHAKMATSSMLTIVTCVRTMAARRV